MIKVLVTVDHQFSRTPDGKVWVKTIYGYEFWKRYLAVFDSVRVAARVHDVNTINEEMLLSSGESVEFFDLLQYRGAKEYLLKYRKINKSVAGVEKGCSCAIFRIPSPISDLVQKHVVRKKIPWATEIINDPWDNFAPGVFKSPLRSVYRRLFARQVKMYALKANGVSYVTQYALQKRYPSYAQLYGTSKEHFESYYSSIILNKDYFWTDRAFHSKQDEYRIVHVNSCVTDFSKGHDVVIRTCKLLRDRGINATVKFIGDGPKRQDFERMARDLSIGDFVYFTGLLSRTDEVRDALIHSDLLVFPTMGEGLPRTVIEAMAVGLPCLSTAVNGIPELLPSEMLLAQQDEEAFAKKATEILMDELYYNEISVRNIERARDYEDSQLGIKRIEFYKKLKDLCQ